MSNGTNPPKKRGCLFYGCLSLVVVAVCVIVFTLLGFHFAKKKFLALREEWTDPAPQAIESVAYPPPQRDALQARLGAFKQALDQGRAGEELVLSPSDLNALIAESAELKGKFFVNVDGDKFTAKVAMPLGDFGPFKLKGRYLNGQATLRVALENQTLDVRVDSVEVRGKPLPNFIMTELKKNNLAKDFNQNPKQSGELDQFDSLQIKDGKITLRSRAKAETPAPPAPTK